MDLSSKDWALIAVIAIAPLAIVILVALIRGYSIKFWLTRPDKKKDEDNLEE